MRGFIVYIQTQHMCTEQITYINVCVCDVICFLRQNQQLNNTVSYQNTFHDFKTIFSGLEIKNCNTDA